MDSILAEQQQVQASANAAEVEQLRQKISQQEEVEEKSRETPISDLGFSGAFFCGPIFEFCTNSLLGHQ